MDIQNDGWKVLAGSCLDRLLELEDNSIDAVVTDPPYELGFMGKSWDSSGIAYNVEVWRQCLRVLKPGGHILAFGGSRTWHRLAVAIEDAGFELRDSIAWIYGSGFPKSLDVSKAIDKNNGKYKVDLNPFGQYVRECREAKGWSRKTLDDLMGTNTAVSWWEGRAAGVQLPSKNIYLRLKEVIGMDNRFDSLIDWAEAEREVIGINKKAELKDSVYFGDIEAAKKSGKAIGYGEFDITAPATPEAQKWQGWGTALKPAFEPVVVGRKPLTGTVAANVLEWGVGGLNIDGTRIGTETVTINTFDNGAKPFGDAVGEPFTSRQSQGRWPSNVMLDEFTAGLVDQQSGVLKSGALKPYVQKVDNDSNVDYAVVGAVRDVNRPADSGGASRFFYVAKASKRDRNEGLDEMPDVEGKRTHSGGEDTRGRPTPVNKNIHPTVKPTELMRNLIRLVTPLGGTVLDPFTGSGSTGKAAILEGMQFVGCELTPEYLPIIEGRINYAVSVKEQELLAEDEKLF